VLHLRWDTLYNALEVLLEKGERLILEVQQHIGDGIVRTIAMWATDRLSRGIPVRDTETAISVPVGGRVSGRMIHVTGTQSTAAER
jgi:F-type H+-transporting ATPase subunit beta